MSNQTKFIVFIVISLCFITSVQTNSSLIGGFQKVDFTSPSDLEALTLFTEANQLCRKEYLKKWGTELTYISEVYSQIVSGVNYKIVYETKCQCNRIYFVVYTQSWTDTVQIVDVGNM